VKNGDISNSSPSRCLITLEVITAGHFLPKKKPWKSWVRIAQDTHLERLVNGALWQISNRMSLIFEVVCFGLPEEFCEALLERLEEEGWLIRYVTAYESRFALSSTLPFRPDVALVIDTNAVAWGARGITIEEAVRGR
jgi:hypothetical protein